MLSDSKLAGLRKLQTGWEYSLRNSDFSNGDLTQPLGHWCFFYPSALYILKISRHLPQSFESFHVPRLLTFCKSMPKGVIPTSQQSAGLCISKPIEAQLRKHCHTQDTKTLLLRRLCLLLFRISSHIISKILLQAHIHWKMYVMKSKKYYISTAILFSLGGKYHKELKIIKLFISNIII